MFLQPDGTSLIQLLNLLIFFAVLNVVFLRPVGRAIQKRREYINSLTADFDRYQEEATELREKAEELRANARRDAEATLTKQRGEASNESAAVSADYAQKVAQRVESAQQEVAAELTAARTGEDRLAQQLADLMLDRTLSEASQ